jgi:hypothetical protein
MKIEQLSWQKGEVWISHSPETHVNAPQLVVVFGAREILDTDEPLAGLRARFPDARIVGCSTAGEIRGSHVHDGGVVASALEFSKVTVREQFETPSSPEDVRAAGARLAHSLTAPDLRHVIVFSDGLHINGSELVEGLAAAMPPGVSVTGGLSADGSNFTRTLVVSGGRAHDGGFVGVGLYGDALRVGYGSQGGWEPFGPRRLVTRSEHNLLLELDGEPALEIYRRYLGPHAAGLPASGLLFPLSIELPGESRPIVRTILGVDEARGGLVFAGDVPVGVKAFLMRARLDGLVDGAIGAATTCRAACLEEPEFAMLVSCVGRRLVMHQRTEEEIEGVRQVIGAHALVTGFYSYGEISAFDMDSRFILHNQTMTITTLAEAA